MNFRRCRANPLTFHCYFIYPVEAVADPFLFAHKIRVLGAQNEKFPRQYEGNPDFN